MLCVSINQLFGRVWAAALFGLLCTGIFWSGPAIASKTGKHALLIDFSRYDHLDKQTPGTDLTMLRRTLIEEGYEVRTIENGTRREVVQAIYNLTYRIDFDDTVFIAIQAGIAMTDRSDDVYILFNDTRANDIEVDGLSLRGLDIMLDRYSTPNQILVLMLDTLGTRVYDSASLQKSPTLSATRNDVQSSISDQLAMLGNERTLLSEIDSRDDKSTETRSIVSLLVSGMRGKADRDNDGIVAAGELQAYVELHSQFVPLVQGQLVAEPLQSSKLVRTTPVESTTAVATPTAGLATRSFKLAVLTKADTARHKKVLADWVVEGLLSRQDNLRLWGLMSRIEGKNKNEIPPKCYKGFKRLEPALQEAYLLQKDAAGKKLESLVVADKVKKLLQAVDASCFGK